MCVFRWGTSIFSRSQTMYRTRKASLAVSPPPPCSPKCSANACRPPALYLSDTLPTAYNAVKDTAVYPGDQVAIFGAGSIGQMAASYALGEGASKIVLVDTEPRLSFVSGRWPAAHKD